MRILSVSWRSFGSTVTTWVKATAHHSQNFSISRWCWRSRGQCSPRPSIRIIALSPCSSESRRGVPVVSGRTKSGSTAPGTRPLLMRCSLWLPRANARDGESEAVDAGERRHVQGAPVGITPGQVVRALRQPERAEVPPVGAEHPDAAGAADVQVAGLVDLEPVNGILARRTGHIEQDPAVGRVTGRVERVAHHDLPPRVPVAD